MEGLTLKEARAKRRDRFAEAEAREVDQLLDDVGLSEEHLGTANVSPHARSKLRFIVAALRKDPHPFSKCMKNLREEQPGWSEERRKKTCNVLKTLAGRNKGQTRAASTKLSQDACALIDDDVAKLLELADEEVLAVLSVGGENLATLTAKKRKSLPSNAFVFAGSKRYPIHDLAHARNALARSSGKPEEAAVKKAVYKKFPQLRPKGGK